MDKRIMLPARTRPRFGLAIAIVFTIVYVPAVAVADSASADPDQPAPEDVIFENDDVSVMRDGDWVVREYANDLSESENRTYNGTELAEGGCRYTGTEAVEPGENPVGQTTLEREVAQNSNECVMKTERGHPNDSQQGRGEDSRGVEDIQSADADDDASPNESSGSEDEDLTLAASYSAWHLAVHDIVNR